MTITIAGAGIAGLAAALAFALQGRSVAVHEKAAAIEPIGAGIQVSPNAMHVLRRLGLERALNAVASAPRSIRIADGVTGEPLTTVPLGRTIEKRFGAPYYSVHRGDLQAVMLDAARNSPNITIHLGSPLDPEAAKGTPEDPLVVASGLHAYPTGNVSAPKHTAWRALVPTSELPNGIDASSTGLWLAPEGHLVHYPVRSGQQTNVVLIVRHEADRTAPPAIRLAEKPAALIATAGNWASWPVFAGSFDHSWTAAGTARIGDAAHPMLPYAAQGGAMAIEDAWTLAHAFDPTNGPASLSRWEVERRRRVQAVAAVAERNRRIYHASGALRLARNVAMRTVPVAALARGMDFVYSWTPSDMAASP